MSLAADSGASMNPVRVIAVEDERLVARDLKLRLKEMGYDVLALAASAEEALELVRNLRPNIILMDIRLEGGPDGIEAARIVRERFDIPVIFVTAHADPETLKRASSTEPFGFVLKPFDDRDLRAAIEIAVFKHKAERRLRETQERLIRAQRVAQLGNWEQDLTTAEFHVSAEACRILGIDCREGASINAERLFSTVHPNEQSAVREAFRTSVTEAKPLRMDHRITSRDGSEKFVRQYGEVVIDHGRGGGFLLGTVQDITDYKDLEERFRRAQKLEAIGRLAGGVAHDFNNLLVVIKGYSDMILSELRSEDPFYDLVREILNAADRATALTRQLLVFSRRQVMRPEPVDLNDLIANFEKMLRRIIPESIEFRRTLQRDIWLVRADPDQMDQVMMNIVVNAKDAMPKGGVLSIATSNAELDEDQVRGFADLKPGRYVSISFTDTGTGIAPEAKLRLFEPFFTTKSVGEGTGLGLSTAYGIVKQHGGEISVYSELGRGSVFKVYLPVAEQADATKAPAPDAGRGSYAGSETILLVEDDDSVRTLTMRMLERQGYTVLAARNGEEAVDLSAGSKGPIDLLLTDVVLPHIGGVELAERIVALRPCLQIVYMSGYPGRDTAEHGVTEANVRFLQKPFSTIELGRKIREALDEGGEDA